jgi:CO/xanthine dehydrogenase Mo-binding subunit
VYDDGSGQLVTDTMMNYALPKADMLPLYETDRTVTPTPVNPLGIKGAGEIGITGATAAIANAVFHATGTRVRDLPITVDKLLGGARP